MSKVAMIGCGAWGMALACHLSRSGHDVTVWCHSDEAAEKLTAERKMEAAFPGIQFPENIVFTHDAELAAKGRDLLVFSVASSFTRSTAKLFAPFVREGQKVVTVTKGIENETFKLQTEIIESEIPGITCAALSGPTHAEEVIRDMPTAIVAAASDRETAEFVQDIFISPFFRVYTSPDVRGVELGGSLKNVIALAAGMADGMGFGDNCKAALMTRGIHEIAGTAVKLGADVRTLTGLSGIGDLKDGTDDLVDGVGQLQDGAGELADGLDEIDAQHQSLLELINKAWRAIVRRSDDGLSAEVTLTNTGSATCTLSGVFVTDQEMKVIY